MTTRQKIFQIIQPDRGESIASRIFDWTITLLILLGVVIVFASTFDLSVSVQRTLRLLGQITTIVFTVEYLLRILTADLPYPERGPIVSRVRYVFSPMALVDLVAILPFWIPMLFPSPMLGLRAVRLVLLLRILKLNRYFDAVRSIGKVLASKRHELIASLFFALLLMLVSSLLMYSAEHEAQPGVFRNAFSGLWWAVATLTTVGYGDIYPVTVLGRILGAFIALSGIAALAVPTGIITAGLTGSLSHRARVEGEVERQRQVDNAHDDELARQRGKDDEHDRLLREQGELLKAIAEKLERLEKGARP